MGSGPVLLLLHGIGDHSASWVPLMPQLAERFTVIAPDLLGHGQSDKPRADYSVAAYANGMRDLLDILEVEHATIVGHSLGGGVAAQLAYQYPHKCERLVLVGSGGVGREVNPALRIASAPFAEILLPPLAWPIGRITTRLAVNVLALLGSDIGRDRDEIDRVLDSMPDGLARFSFSRTLRSVVDWRGQVVTMLDRSYLAEPVPTFLVWGERDGVIPVAHAHRAAEALPNARLSIYPDAGHFPHHSDPDRFITELLDFIDTTEPFEHRHDLWRQRLVAGAPVPIAAGDADGESSAPALVG